MSKILNKNILNLKDEREHGFSWKRLFMAIILIFLVILIIMFINGYSVNNYLKK